MIDLTGVMSYEDLYRNIVEKLGLTDLSDEEIETDPDFRSLWDSLSKTFMGPGLSRVIEIHSPQELLVFLTDLLDIKIEEDESNPQEEAEDRQTCDDGHKAVGALSEPEVQEINDEIFRAQVDELDEEIKKDRVLSQDNDFKILWDTLKDCPMLTILIEEMYVDRIYRDSYYTYYSSKHFSYNRYCRRLFVFEGLLSGSSDTGNILNDFSPEDLQKHFVGSFVLRPLHHGKIGRTLVNPYYVMGRYDIKDVYVRTSKYEMTMFGKGLRVKAFPYSMQDTETTSCAEITILNMLDYYSNQYADYRFILPSEIISIAVNNGFERRLPTRGLDYEMISKVFMETGFHPVLYSAAMTESYDKFKRILHYYIESGIPTALGLVVSSLSKHSIVCIGHGRIRKDKIGKRKYSIPGKTERTWLIDSSDFVDDYIVMDDNQRPYSVYSWEGDEYSAKLSDMTPEFIMVPLYKRMFLEAIDAYDICTTILADEKLGIRRAIEAMPENCEEKGEYNGLGTEEKPVLIRLFMTSARGLKRQRVSEFSKINTLVQDTYVNTPFPRFVWVCELYRKERYSEHCCGEIIIDATAAPNDRQDSAIIIQYPYKIASQMPDQIEHSLKFTELNTWSEFKGYRRNLQVPQPSGNLLPGNNSK